MLLHYLLVLKLKEESSPVLSLRTQPSQPKKSNIFSTAADGQTEVEIKIFQGEREIAEKNKLLGQFKLSGFPPAPKGVPQIEVTFDIDANGIVHVSAKDKATGKENDIRIKSSGGLSEAEIQRMQKEAEENAEADKKRRDLVEIKNKADSTIDDVNKHMKDFKQYVDAEGEQKLKEAIKNLEDKVNDESEDVEAINEAIGNLQEVQLKVFEVAYKEGKGASNNSNESNDADYKEVDKDK